MGDKSRAEEEEEGTTGLPAAESELESATDSASLLAECKDAAEAAAAEVAVGRKCAK